MKAFILTAAICVVCTWAGCSIPQIVRPLRLYDLKDGNTVEVYLHQTFRDHGRLVSAAVQGEKFQGEFVVYDRTTYVPRPYHGSYDGTNRSSTLSEADMADLAELYGYGKNSEAKPVGSAILVGNQGTVIDIVFYSVSSDLQSADGIARDNKGRHYRVFMSVEERY